MLWKAGKPPQGLSIRGPAFRPIARPLSRLLGGLVNEQSQGKLTGAKPPGDLGVSHLLAFIGGPL